MKHIHIVGSGPRSGTTLLYELMTCSFAIDHSSPHESRIGKMPPYNCDVYLTKAPKDIVVIGPILQQVPDLFVIFVMRDPRDSAVSIHQIDAPNYYGTLEYWHNYMPFYDGIKDHHRVLTVRYEDLVADPDALQQQIAARFPFLRITDRFSHFHQNTRPSEMAQLALNGVRQVSASSVGNWESHKGKIKADIEAFGPITNDLIRFGYEPSAEWEQKLTDVAPVHGKQHRSVFSSKEWIHRKLRSQPIRIWKVRFFHSAFFLRLLSLVGRSK